MVIRKMYFKNLISISLKSKINYENLCIVQYVSILYYIRLNYKIL